jgi:hypothetical protein
MIIYSLLYVGNNDGDYDRMGVGETMLDYAEGVGWATQRGAMTKAQTMRRSIHFT